MKLHREYINIRLRSEFVYVVVTFVTMKCAVIAGMAGYYHSTTAELAIAVALVVYLAVSCVVICTEI